MRWEPTVPLKMVVAPRTSQSRPRGPRRDRRSFVLRAVADRLGDDGKIAVCIVASAEPQSLALIVGRNRDFRVLGGGARE